MRPRCPALLLFAVLGGCELARVDEAESGAGPDPVGGAGDDGTAADGTPGTDGTSGTDGADGADGTGDSAAPVDADGDGVFSNEDCDDGDADRFPGNPEACDGVDNDCSGAAEVDGDGVCGFWLLDAATSSWTAHPMETSPSVHTPTDTLQVAFSVGLDRVWALTSDTFHVLALDSLLWIGSGDRDLLFPEASGKTLTLAMKAPNSWDAQDQEGTVTLQYEYSALAYAWNPSTSGFTLVLDTELGADWQADLAPPAASVRAGWLGHDGDFAWTYPASPQDACGRGGDALGPYFAILTDDARMHIYDAGHCFGFVASMPEANFPVFSYPGSPDPAALGSTAWTRTGVIAFVDGP